MRFRTPLALALFAASAILIAGPAMAANDRYWNEMWGIHKIQADKAWASSTGRGVVVAVLDTGVDASHPDLKNQMAGNFTCLGGTCRVDEERNDPVGHGTHVAGTIAAQTGNDLGVSSVAPEAQILSIKVCPGRGCEGRAISAGIRFAADRAQVINMSLGGSFTIQGAITPQADVQEAWARGAVIVVSSGNDPTDDFSGYSGEPNVVVVGATGPDDKRSAYTTGTESELDIDIFAPGGNAVGGGCDFATCILSTVPKGQYATFQGTSMAAPHVAGVVALLRCQGVLNVEVESILKSTADNTSAGRRVNAFRAVSGRPRGNCPGSYPGSPAIQSETATSFTPSARTDPTRGGTTPRGGGAQAGQTDEAQVVHGQAEQIGLGDYKDPEAGSLLAAEEKKKVFSTKTLINIGIAAALVAAAIGWYFFARRRKPAEE